MPFDQIEFARGSAIPKDTGYDSMVDDMRAALLAGEDSNDAMNSAVVGSLGKSAGTYDFDGLKIQRDSGFATSILVAITADLGPMASLLPAVEKLSEKMPAIGFLNESDKREVMAAIATNSEFLQLTDKYCDAVVKLFKNAIKKCGGDCDGVDLIPFLDDLYTQCEPGPPADE
jgi:hypothetical protein